MCQYLLGFPVSQVRHKCDTFVLWCDSFVSQCVTSCHVIEYHITNVPRKKSHCHVMSGIVTTVTQPGGHDKIVTHPCHNCDTTPPPCWEYMEEGEVILHQKNQQNQNYLKCPPLNFESWFRSPRHTILTTGYYCDNLLSLNISILSQSTQNALHQYVNTNLLIFLQTVFPITYVYWHIENMGRVDWKINI